MCMLLIATPPRPWSATMSPPTCTSGLTSSLAPSRLGRKPSGHTTCSTTSFTRALSVSSHHHSLTPPHPTPSHHHTITPSYHHTITPSHHHSLTPSHPHTTPSHLHIITPSHHHSLTPSHQSTQLCCRCDRCLHVYNTLLLPHVPSHPHAITPSHHHTITLSHHNPFTHHTIIAHTIHRYNTRNRVLYLSH